jgi:type IV secretory pathway VirB10-like protein
MENLDTPTDPVEPSVVHESIPSAVRSGASMNPLMWLGLLVVALVIVLVLKGGSRKASEVPVADTMVAANPYPSSLAIPSTPLQTIQTMVPPSSLERDDAAALRDVRRKSPMVIFNNAMTGSAASGPAAADGAQDQLPLPQGYHPSKDAESRSTTLGNREFIIAQGKLIDAVLETAVNTDQPGMLRALVSNDIYGDSGRTILLPRGSRLIGQYNSDVARGQSRVFVIWQRVIRPDGMDIQLDSGGTDALGQAGVDGKVDNHFLTMFGAATLLSVIGASAATVGVQPQDNNNSISSYRTSVSQGFSDAANTVLGTFVRIKPTITIHQGAAIKVFVARDLYFDPAVLGAERVQVIP